VVKIFQRVTRFKQPKIFLITNRLLPGIFALALALLLNFAGTAPSPSQTPMPPSMRTSALNSRDALIEKIKKQAAFHVENDKAPDEKSVLDRYRDQGKQVGLKPDDIAIIYQDEYTKLKKAKDSNLWEKVNDELLWKLGWPAAIGFLFLFLFKEAVVGWGSSLFNVIGNWLYNKVAGFQLFWAISLRRYRKGLINKHQQLKIPFRPNRPLNLGEVYVPLKATGTSDSELIDLERAVIEYPNLMVKGLPGSGKSMLLRNLALRYALGYLKLPKRAVPVLLELNRLSEPGKSLEQHLVEALDRDDFPNAERFVSCSLEQGTLILLLDGLDEVNSSNRKEVIRQIKDLLDKHSECSVIITCRTAVYNGEFADTVNQTLEVAEFSDQQIRCFLASWAKDMPPEKSVEQLMQTLHDRPRIMALARNPLILTIIAYLYTDTLSVLPHSRAEFYRESIDILLKKWDESRQTPNSYKGPEKRLVLQHLALYGLDRANQQQKDRRALDYQMVLNQVIKILPDLNLEPGQHAQLLLDEIVERSGLLLAIDGGEKYQFAHLTLQEFFSAEALREKESELIDRFEADPTTWRETTKLWCGMVGESTALIKNVYAIDPITAFECLADAQKVDSQVASKIIDDFKVQLGVAGVDNEEAVHQAFGSVAADDRPRGKEVFKFLKETLQTDRDLPRQMAAANALSMTNLPEAIDVLVSQYADKANLRPVLHQSLIRMGDLAVSKILASVETEAVELMDILVDIGTPLVTQRLVLWLWHENQNLASRAAMLVAHLLRQPNQEEVLGNYKLTEEQKRKEQMDWIWKPFSNNQTLNTIVGRVAYLISQVPAKGVNRVLDSRIVVPICLVENQDERIVELLEKFRKEYQTKTERIQRLLQIFEGDVSDKRSKRIIEGVKEYHEWMESLLEELASTDWGYLFFRVLPSEQIQILRDIGEYGMIQKIDWENYWIELKRKNVIVKSIKKIHLGLWSYFWFEILLETLITKWRSIDKYPSIQRAWIKKIFTIKDIYTIGDFYEVTWEQNLNMPVFKAVKTELLFQESRDKNDLLKRLESEWEKWIHQR
jgi:hypothetical protein